MGGWPHLDEEEEEEEEEAVPRRLVRSLPLSIIYPSTCPLIFLSICFYHTCQAHYHMRIFTFALPLFRKLFLWSLFGYLLFVLSSTKSFLIILTEVIPSYLLLTSSFKIPFPLWNHRLYFYPLIYLQSSVPEYKFHEGRDIIYFASVLSRHRLTYIQLTVHIQLFINKINKGYFSDFIR